MAQRFSAAVIALREMGLQPPMEQRRADMYVTTLQDFVKALGGELKITAKFPEGTVGISQFEDVKKAAAGKD